MLFTRSLKNLPLEARTHFARGGIRRRMAFTMTLLVLGVTATLSYLQFSAHKLALENELSKRTRLMQENLHHRALFQATQLQQQAEDDLASYSLFHLANTLDYTAFNTRELEFAILIDKNQRIVIHTASPDMQQKTLPPGEFKGHIIVTLQPRRLRDSGETSGPTHDYQPFTLIPGVTHLSYKVPVNVGSENWGAIFLSYSLNDLQEEIHRSHSENSDAIHELAIRTFIVTAVILLLTYLIISRLARRLSAPIVRLTGLAKRLSGGDFSAGQQVRTKTEDEVGVLADSFAEMAKHLKHSYEQLEGYSTSLEVRVAQRTEELNERNKALTKALRELEESQQQLIQAEKMAALGQLVASVAHEINTPLGAIQASVGNTGKYYRELLSRLPRLLSIKDAASIDLLQRLLTHSHPMEALTTREERQARRQIVQHLEDAHIDEADELADMLIDMGLHTQLPTLLDQFKIPDLRFIVECAYHLSGIQRSSATIFGATARAAKVVFALKNFTHYDHSGERIEANINESLNTVLVLYQGLLKQGVDVIRHYSELPPLRCYPDELNQVWTNLIHNALQAMSNQGSLTISTLHRQSGPFSHELVVNITDTGAGIPENLQEKVWDTFFTTKPAGEGSGLGLGICKRIIDKHNGDISFESEAGRTTFTVVLPYTD